jgi:hypothetical protein
MNRPVGGHSSDIVSPHQHEHVHAYKRTTVLGTSLCKCMWILVVFSPEIIHTYMHDKWHILFSAQLHCSFSVHVQARNELGLEVCHKIKYFIFEQIQNKEQSTFDVISGFHKNDDNADQLKNLGEWPTWITRTCRFRNSFLHILLFTMSAMMPLETVSLKSKR